MTPWSVRPMAGISSSAARWTMAGMRLAPSRSEYSVWLWRWTKVLGVCGIVWIRAGGDPVDSLSRLTTVPAWTANALTVAGTVIATAGFVLTARFFVRYLKARGSLPGDRKEAARAQLRMLASGSTHLIVEGIGVTMLFAGTVMPT